MRGKTTKQNSSQTWRGGLSEFRLSAPQAPFGEYLTATPSCSPDSLPLSKKKQQTTSRVKSF